MNAHLPPHGISASPSSTRHLALVALIIVAGLAPSALHAQRIPDINAPIRAAEKARALEDRHISDETGQAMPDRKNGKSPATPLASGPGSTPPAPGIVGAQASTTAPGPMTPVTREIFSYESEGRRDPFFSLILTEELRPLLSDLKLVGILYASSGHGSVAIMRDVLTNAQYRVNTGQTIGRMRVAQIKPRAVIFTIDEFGLSRQDSLFLVDSTKVRIR